MSKRNFCVGMGMGLMVGFCLAMLKRPKKSCMKSALGRTLRTIGDIADTVTETMGW